MTTKRKLEILDAYRSTGSLRRAANLVGVTMQYVHQVVRELAPQEMNVRSTGARRTEQAS